LKVRKLIALVLTGVLLILLGKWGYARVHDALVLPGCTITTEAEELTLDTEQSANAATIAAVAYRRGIPERAITVAFTAAQQESKLRNLDYGDRDSLGIFQQRPSQGWGDRESILDPTRATSRFYSALINIPDWEKLPLAQAAQEVQRSAAGSAYEKWEGRALALTQALNDPSLITCRFHKFGTQVHTPAADVIERASKEWGRVDAKHIGRVIRITSRQRTHLAIWFMTHASELGVTQLRWNQIEWDRYGIKSKNSNKVSTLTVTLQ